MAKKSRTRFDPFDGRSPKLVNKCRAGKCEIKPKKDDDHTQCVAPVNQIGQTVCGAWWFLTCRGVWQLSW